MKINPVRVNLPSFTLLSALIALAPQLAIAAEGAFPLRARFPSVPTIELAEVARRYSELQFVDVRSAFEFDAAHMEGAVNIPISRMGFVVDVSKLRGPEGLRPLVFYCNGLTCKKSYQAATKAIEAGFRNVFAFDAGVRAWVIRHPEHAVLMGQQPADASKLISDGELAQHTLPLAESLGAGDAIAVCYDIREPYQIQKQIPLKKVRYLPLDAVLAMLKARKFQENTLYVLDATGHQVEWLQYYLKQYGYSRYFFLREGIDGAGDS